MPITCTDLRQYGKELAVAASTETQLRSSVSRSYYAAFHSLVGFVEDLPKSEHCKIESDVVSHHEMSQRLSEWKTDGLHPKLAGMKSIKGQIVRTLDAARAMRIKADYHLNGMITLGDAQSQHERACQLIRMAIQIDTMLKPSVPSVDSAGQG